MSRAQTVVATIGGLLITLALFLGWRWWSADTPLELVEQRAAAMFSGFNGAPGPPPENRREEFRALRRDVEALSPEDRERFYATQRERMMAREMEDLNQFFALSTTERTAEIDKRLDQMVAWRGQWEARRAERPEGGDGERRREDRGRGDGDGVRGPPPGAGPPGDGPPRGGPRDGGSRDGGGGRRGFSGDPQEINQWRRQRLDQTTPEYRAKRDEYRRLMQERMEARGMPVPPWMRR